MRIFKLPDGSTPTSTDVSVLEREAPAATWTTKGFLMSALMTLIRSANILTANGVVAGSYGSAANSLVVTIDSLGLVTTATTVTEYGPPTNLPYLTAGFDEYLVGFRNSADGLRLAYDGVHTYTQNISSKQAYYKHPSLPGTLGIWTNSALLSGTGNGEVLEFKPTTAGDKFLLEAYGVTGITAYDNASCFIKWVRVDNVDGTGSNAATTEQNNQAAQCLFDVYDHAARDWLFRTAVVVTAESGKAFRLVADSGNGTYTANHVITNLRIRVTKLP